MHDIWAINVAALRRLMAVDVSAAGPVPEGAGERQAKRAKQIAVLPLYGVLEPRTSMRGWIMGGTSTVAFGAAFDAAVADESVSGILIDADSPGGSVMGTQELADKVFAARGVKPIIAVANHQADSAAYWITSQADRLYVSPSARVGSVGTMITVQDWSAAYEQAGVKEHLIVADDSPHKGEWVESQGVSDEYLAYLRAMANEYQRPFVASVARGRGVSIDDVRSNFGKGRDVGAPQAVSSGMADGVATFDQVLGKMLSGGIRLRRNASTESRRLSMLSALAETY